MTRQTYLELSLESQEKYMAEVLKIYNSLDQFSKYLLLEFMCEDGTIKNEKNEKIYFMPYYKDESKIKYSISYYNPGAECGKNNYISGYKFDVLEK
jgi:hypothetical protein